MYSANQYEEKIHKLEEKLKLQEMKSISSVSTIATLRQQVKELTNQIEQERQDHVDFLEKNKLNHLLAQLDAERAQRLHDLQEIEKKNREIKLLSNEVAVATTGAILAQQESAESRAEIVGLKKTIQCSANLVRIAETDFAKAHKELEETKLELVEIQRKFAEQKEELHPWVDRYQQAMVDLHMTQLKLSKQAVGNTAKQDAHVRGYGVLLRESGGEPVSLQSRHFYSAKQGSAFSNGYEDDTALARFRRQTSESTALRDTLASQARVLTALSPADVEQMRLNTGFSPLSGDSNSTKKLSRNHGQSAPSLTDTGIKLPGVAGIQVDHFPKGKKPRGKKLPSNQQHYTDSIRSNYLGHGLGLKKKDPVNSALRHHDMKFC